MTLYAYTILLAELLMFAMGLHVLNYTGFTQEQKKWFLLTFCSIMFCAAAEYLVLKMDGVGGACIIPLTAITVIQFSLAPLLPVFFAGALGIHSLARPAFYLFAVNALVEIIAAPFGFIFYYTENGKYSHGQFYILYEVFYTASMFFLIISLIMVGRRFHHRDVCTIVMVLVILATSVVPLVLFRLHSDYIGIAVSACLCYIYYNDLTQQDIKAELIENQQRMSEITEHIIYRLADLIENRDGDTGEHIVRTSTYVRILSEAARTDGIYADTLNDNYVMKMQMLAPLHDIGKISVPDRILLKPGKLTADEYEEMKKHATVGGEMVQRILEGIADAEHMQVASAIAMHHHERWDGTGYPDGLAGEEIPLPARIMAIADVYDALISERCYKEAMTPEQAFAVIEEEAGTHFDPFLARAFINHKDEIKEFLSD